MEGVRALVVAGILAAGAPAAALAGVDVETGGSLKAKGTLAPSGESEDFSFRAAEGTLLAVSLKGDPKSGLDPSLRLLNLDFDDEVELGPPALLDAGSSVTLKSLPIPYTGRWTLRVSGAGTGGYALSVKTKPPKSASATLLLSVEGEEVFEFAAAAGSVLSMAVKAAKGSAAVPRFLAITPEGRDDVDLSEAGRIGPTSHSVTMPAPGNGEDLSLYLTSVGAAEGEASLSVRIKAPKPKKEKLDLRGEALGSPGGGETFVSRVIGAGGGSVHAGEGSALEGAGLEIPGGALAEDVVIVLASAAAPPPPTKDDQSIGPAVDLRPSGLQFETPALLTLPFDPSLLPVGADPEDLRVLVVEENGTTFELAPSSVNVEAGSLAVPVGGFSVCIPVIRSGLPRLGVAPGGDEYWNLTLEYEVEPSPAGNDSRARSFLLEVGETSFYGDGTVQTSSSFRSFSFGNTSVPGGTEAGLQTFESTQEYGATWSYGADARSIEVQEGDGGPVFAVSRDGSVLLERGEEDEPGTGFGLLLRKGDFPADEAALAGTWFFGGVELQANVQGFQVPASVEISRSFGTLTFDGKGGARFSESFREAAVDGGTGNVEQVAGSGQGTATYALQEDGTILLTVPPDDGDDEADLLRIHPGRGGDVLFLVDDGPCGSCTYALILVRQGSGLSPAVLDGDYRGSLFSQDLAAYLPPSGTGPATFAGDAHLFALDFDAAFDGGGTVSLDGIEHRVARDPGVAGGVASDLEEVALSLDLAVDGKGRLTLSMLGGKGQPGILVGATAADGMVAFFVTNPAVADADFGLGFMVKVPPAAE
ncbi:MAG: hypothetical protein L6R43_03740 [Planctomycetes bacterium]|nr:hypothetical protein [Planctomycetota bacterium]